MQRQRQRPQEPQRREKPYEKERMPSWPMPHEELEKLRREADEFKEKLKKDLELRQRQLQLETLRADEASRRTSMEEWLNEVIIDPSFFLSKPRFEALLHLLGALQPQVVIVASTVHDTFMARYEKQRIEDIEREDYYALLSELIRQWEPPSRTARKKILGWIGSAGFRDLLTALLKFNLQPTRAYLETGPTSNPLDLAHAKDILGEISGRAFYEMTAVSEKLGRPIISTTRGFVRLCHKMTIHIYESYTAWKANFKKQHRIAGRFLIYFMFGAAAFRIGTATQPWLPPDIQAGLSTAIATIVVLDG